MINKPIRVLITYFENGSVFCSASTYKDDLIERREDHKNIEKYDGEKIDRQIEFDVNLDDGAYEFLQQLLGLFRKESGNMLQDIIAESAEAGFREGEKRK